MSQAVGYAKTFDCKWRADIRLIYERSKITAMQPIMYIMNNSGTHCEDLCTVKHNQQLPM